MSRSQGKNLPIIISQRPTHKHSPRYFLQSYILTPCGTPSPTPFSRMSEESNNEENSLLVEKTPIKEKEEKGKVETCFGYRKFFCEELSKVIRAKTFVAAAKKASASLHKKNLTLPRSHWCRFTIQEKRTKKQKHYKSFYGRPPTEVSSREFEKFPVNYFLSWISSDRNLYAKMESSNDNIGYMLHVADQHPEEFREWLILMCIVKRYVISSFKPLKEGEERNRPTKIGITLYDDENVMSKMTFQLNWEKTTVTKL